MIYLCSEIADGKDNDCDGGIDEKTTVTDDDGDSLSEIEGCNDNDKDTYQELLKNQISETTIVMALSMKIPHCQMMMEMDFGLDNDCNDRNKDINPATIGTVTT